MPTDDTCCRMNIRLYGRHNLINMIRCIRRRTGPPLPKIAISCAHFVVVSATEVQVSTRLSTQVRLPITATKWRFRCRLRSPALRLPHRPHLDRYTRVAEARHRASPQRAGPRSKWPATTELTAWTWSRLMYRRRLLNFRRRLLSFQSCSIPRRGSRSPIRCLVRLV